MRRLSATRPRGPPRARPPTWGARLNYQGLSDKSQQAFRGINLRWHDLRHEYASRLVEHGVPLAQVRDLLGHASITTTERYDNQTVANLQIAAAKLERGQMFAPSAVKASRFFQDRPPTAQGFDAIRDESSENEARYRRGIRAHSRPAAGRRGVPEALRTSPNEAKPREWLGRRDSNPDNHVQRGSGRVGRSRKI